jgi:hypothetical protein
VVTQNLALINSRVNAAQAREREKGDMPVFAPRFATMTRQ